ncbi:predicted protein [Sclerotinia sclerotiorum 1980 UF-70]|uniref:Uncharacterized protein n=1 Tax=Sclerotinia sclerotiorum (strain ATCC 18683 / 1980 / Ss-1) TaxID=665079 RepID=A7F3Y8_SCLS1|nr:predicted protein [Sclerotinia sclerotiorum 1980 UF-70]EDN97459.1 predicted protein [Sclerotinia sclerotiorum 1980 UF-70]
MGKASRDLFGGVATGSRKRPAKFMHNGFGGETAVDDDVSEYNDDNPDNKLEYRAILTASMALRERRFLLY